MRRFQKSALLFVCCCSLLSAAEPPPDRLFASSEPLAITLRGPFSVINTERSKDRAYAGSLTYTSASGTDVVLEAEFTPRGNWRLEPGNCRYAQLWVNLRRSQTPGTLFENQNRLKLVLQCGRQARYADYLYKELQAYRIFQELSEYNFDTRLLNVTYAESEGSEGTRTQPAFFIEHQNRLAARWGFEGVEEHRVARDALDPLQTAVVGLFMYLLGNTDFNLQRGPNAEECCHNAKALRDEDGRVFVVPYDFDATGWVDANYAPDPHPRYNLRNNRSRLYLGFCNDTPTEELAVDRFRQSREDLSVLVEDAPLISERASSRNLRYLEDYFSILDDPRAFERSISRRCLR